MYSIVQLYYYGLHSYCGIMAWHSLTMCLPLSLIMEMQMDMFGTFFFDTSTMNAYIWNVVVIEKLGGVKHQFINFQPAECLETHVFPAGFMKAFEQLHSIGLAFAQCEACICEHGCKGYLCSALRRIHLSLVVQCCLPVPRELLLPTCRGSCLHSQGKWRASSLGFKGREATEDCRILMGIRGSLEAAIHEETSNRTWTMMIQTAVVHFPAAIQFPQCSPSSHIFPLIPKVLRVTLGWNIHCCWPKVILTLEQKFKDAVWMDLRPAVGNTRVCTLWHTYIYIYIYIHK